MYSTYTYRLLLYDCGAKSRIMFVLSWKMARCLGKNCVGLRNHKARFPTGRAPLFISWYITSSKYSCKYLIHQL
jgi:hypothetical protein